MSISAFLRSRLQAQRLISNPWLTVSVHSRSYLGIDTLCHFLLELPLQASAGWKDWNQQSTRASAAGDVDSMPSHSVVASAMRFRTRSMVGPSMVRAAEHWARCQLPELNRMK